jgi:hypothetical protein
MASERIHRERRLQHLFYCCVTSPRTWRVPLLRVYVPSPSNRSTSCIAPSLRLFVIFVPNSLQANRHFFFSEGCVCDICDRSHLPSPRLGSHGDYSPTIPAAPSLRPLVLSGSLIRCEPFQVYHHHPRSRVPLDTVYHIIYLGDYLVWALPWGLEPSCGLDDRATLYRRRGSPRSWPVCRNEFSSGHWPASGVGGHMLCRWSTKFAAWPIVSRSLSRGAPNSRSQGSRSSFLSAESSARFVPRGS